MKRFLPVYWFPAALVVLLLLFLPGLVLFGLNLFGWEKSANERLIDGFNLSYHLALPWWGVLLLLLVGPLIVLLYFLKLKRKPLSVPSTFLWRKSIEDLHVNSLFQWLRQNVLLLLQLLTVVLIVYGVMAFHLHGQGGTGRHYIILIDNSASMSATDVMPNRLAMAKEDALKIIDSATDNDFGMVIAFNSSAHPLQLYTSNRDLLRQAVKSINPTQMTTRIDEALSLADSLANPLRSTEDAAVAPDNPDPGKERTYVRPQGVLTEVHLFSDGRFPNLSEKAQDDLNARSVGESALGNLDLRYHAVGNMVLEESGKDKQPILRSTAESRDNVGIVTFNARRDEELESRRRELRASGKTAAEIEPGKVQVLIGVRNYSDQVAHAAIDIDVHENGQFKDSLPRQLLEIPAQVRQEATGDIEAAAENWAKSKGTATFEISEVDNRGTVVLHARIVLFRDRAGAELYQKEGKRTADSVRGDRFALDDEAWLVIGVRRKSRVLIVGHENEVLTAFFDLDATREVAEVKRLEPEDLVKEDYLKPARNGTYDMVIFDRCGPADEKDMPRSNTFFIGYPPPPWKLSAPAKPSADAKVVEKLAGPRIKGWDSKHPVLRYLAALYDLGILDAFTLRDLPQRQRLIETDRNGTVLFVQPRGAFTDLVLTFALLDDNSKWNSDWPLQPSFPLFLRNVIYHLGNVRDEASEDRVQPGEVKVLRPDTTVRRGEVIDPNGKITELVHGEHDARTDFDFGATERLGPYQVKWQKGPQRSFAVNLLDSEESDIEPRSAFQVGSVSIEAGGAIGQPREVWKLFALLALLVLLLEWYIYNRRVYI